MKISRWICRALFTFIIFSTPLKADPNIGVNETASSKHSRHLTLAIDEHAKLARSALDKELWSEAQSQYQIILRATKEGKLFAEALYNLAWANYKLGLYEEANTLLSDYLKELPRDERYDDIVELKFRLAQKFELGARRRIFGWSFMPRWLSGRDIALEIYEEVAQALPRSELAGKALLARSNMFIKNKRYNEARVALEQVITDFDRNPIALEAFEKLSKLYLREMETTSRSEELLELAKINEQKLAKRFPNANLEQVKTAIAKMRELYAQSLLDTAYLYHKKGKLEAAKLYLGRLKALYSDTQAGRKAEKIEKKGQF